MGSGAEAVEETVEAMIARENAKVGVLKVRLFRPFPAAELIKALPATVRKIAVLDRTKEPGSQGEPLHQDVIQALFDAQGSGTLPFTNGMPKVVGGRYGLSSKEFTPGSKYGGSGSAKTERCGKLCGGYRISFIFLVVPIAGGESWTFFRCV